MDVLRKVLEEKYHQPDEKKGVELVNYTPSPLSSYSAPRPSVEAGMVLRDITQRGLANSWLYTAMTKKARSFASVPIILEKRGRKGWQREEEHELAALLSKPNPQMSMQDCMERWAMHLEISGNALAHRVKAGDGRTLELWPIAPDVIKPKRTYNDDSWTLGYLFRPAAWANEIALTTDDVTHWMYQNPADTRWGLSPMLAAAGAVNTDLSAQRWNRQVLDGGARPIGAVLMNESLSDDEWQVAMTQVNEAARDRLRQFLVFGGATKVESFGFNPSEMDFLSGRKFSRDEICSVLGVPSILVAQGQDATYSNMETAKRGFWEDTIVPLLNDFVSTLAKGLLADFKLDPSKWRIRADLSDVAALRDNESQRLRNEQVRAATAMTYIKSGFAPESVAEHLGLPFATAQQLAAVQALKGLSPPARAHLEAKHNIVIEDLTPAEALGFVIQLQGGEA